MPRFHFHIRDGSSLISDGEGMVLYDEAAAFVVATRAIREQVAIDIRHDGVVRLDQTIEIVDPDGKLIQTVDFAQVIHIAAK